MKWMARPAAMRLAVRASRQATSLPVRKSLPPAREAGVTPVTGPVPMMAALTMLGPGQWTMQAIPPLTRPPPPPPPPATHLPLPARPPRPIMTGTVCAKAPAGTKPEMLSGPRDGGADNLKEIKGVGPKLEKLLNSLGVYHFDQVAGWSADEVAWVDANLEGFKGRVSRDDWVGQARILAAGGDTEFSKRVDKGDVY